MTLAAVPLGLAIGLAVGTLGGGGSVLAVPVLVYVLRQDVHAATTASLVVVTAAALAGSLGHASQRRVCWRHAGAFTAAAVPGVFAGTLAGDAVGGTVLLGAFAVVMLAAAYGTWRRTEADDGAQDDPRQVACPPLRMARDVTAGVLLGFVTGFLGVGGGFLVVPTLALVLAFRIRSAVGTSLAIITGTSLVGLVAHLLAGRGLDPGVTATLTGACVAGALAGVAVAGVLPQRALGRGFALLVTGVAAYLIVAIVLLGGPPSGS